MAIIKVKTGGITADAITDALIADDVVGTEHLTANEVDTTALKGDAVTGAELADDAVNSEHYTDGSIDTAHLADGQVTTAKLATAVFTGATDIGAAIVDADLFLMDDGAGGTIRKTTAARIKTYAGASMTPAFHALLSANQEGLSDGATTRINCNTEILDSDNAYDNSSNYRFTPQTAGKYFVYAQVMADSDGTANLVDMDLEIRKNNTTISKSTMNFSNNNIRLATINSQAVISLNGSSDYLDVYVYVNTGDGGNYKIIADSTQQRSYLGAFKIIE